jgi:hypothetical protein
VTSLIIILAQYPDDVIDYVTDPRTGIQRRCKFPPTIAEIIEACDARMQDIAKRERFKNWGKRDEPVAIGPPK